MVEVMIVATDKVEVPVIVSDPAVRPNAPRFKFCVAPKYGTKFVASTELLGKAE